MARVRPVRTVALAGLAFAALAPPAAAGPAGENVVSGTAQVERAGDLTVITTGTDRTHIQWLQGFDIAPDEAVRIDQPGVASITLNEVLSTDPTRIDGLLTSNGQVWIVNPVGVFFGDQAIVDVGGLVAAAGRVGQEDFLAGLERFTDLSGSVEVAAGAELAAAQSVLLVGATVANYGHITAEDGMIALVAGGEVRLTRVDGRVTITADRALAPDPELWAVQQAGTLDAGAGRVSLTAGDAYSLAMNHSGITRAREIEVAGGDGLVQVDGALDASADSPGERGGRIAVTGDRVGIGDARLDASGDAGGGDILVGGDAHGTGDTPTATRTYVSPDALLRADAGASGDGGRIVVWADDATRFYGTLSARGGAEGGDGGFAEISGKRSLVSRGAVDLGAEAGAAGTLLYDPLRIVIQGGTADGTDANDATPPETFLRGDFGTPGSIASTDVGDGDEPFVIYESEIEGTDANLVLEATQSIETQGTFGANDLAIAPGRDVTLTVTDGGADVPPGEFVGIDVATHDGGGELLWKLSQGGIFAASVTSSEGRDAVLAVGAVGTQGVRDGTTHAVTIASTGVGDVAVGSITTSGAQRVGSGSEVVFGVTVDTVAAGNVSVTAETGDVAVGSVEALGGDSTAADPGDGGAGGDVTVTTADGAIAVGDVAVDGGIGVGTFDGDDGPEGFAGGAGGDVTVTAQASDPQVVSGRDVLLSGAISSRGGAGDPSDPGETDGIGGTVAITAAGGLTAASSGAALQAATLQLVGRNVGGGGDLVLASAQAGSPTEVDGTATVQASGDLRVVLSDADRFDRFELIQKDATAMVDVLRDGGGTIARGRRDPIDPDLHRIEQLTTDANDPFFVYRLADTGPDPDLVQIDVAELAVETDAVSLGAQGGVIANARSDANALGGEQLLGRIQGDGGGPHIQSSGGVQLFATNIGDTTPLNVGSTPSLELQVAGDVDLVVGSGVEIVDLVQGSAAGNVDMDLPGSGSVQIEGTVVDDGGTRTEASHVVAVNTSGGPDFFYHMADDSESSDEPGTGEPLLTIGSGAVTVGDATRVVGFATTGNLVLEGERNGVIAPAIDANGGTVLLIADSNLDGLGAIEASGEALDIDGAGALVAYADSGVGSEAKPLRTSAPGAMATMALSGTAGSGDFRLENTVGDVSIERIEVQVASEGETVGVSYGGVYSNTDVVIDNGDRGIYLGPIQPEDIDPLWLRNDAPSIALSGPEDGTDLLYGFGGLTFPLVFLTQGDPTVTNAHVASGGSQTFGGTGGTVWVNNERMFDDPDAGMVTVNQAILRAGGDVIFEGNVDSSAATPADLDVGADGTIQFGGNVGGDPNGPLTIANLTLTNAFFTAGAHTVTTGFGQFGRLDGPADLMLRGVGTGSQLVFGGDVGTLSTLARFDADADLLNFAGADRIVAGSVALNTATPSATVPAVATIIDTDPGGLSIQSSSTVAMGTNEKLSAAGPLAIAAGAKATLGDLSATQLNVAASEIEIQGRAPAAVELPDGTFVVDRGVDWVANDIETNVVPWWDPATGPPPTFVLGNGGIVTGPFIPFEVIRFSSNAGRVRPTGFYGVGGVLDLVGLGQRVVSDPSKDIPRKPPGVSPALQARFTDTAPELPPPPSEAEVLATVRCGTPGDGLCPTREHGDGPLDDERSREIVQDYHALLGTPQAHHQLAAAFEPVARSGVLAAGDGSALYRSPADTPEFDEARDRVDELAVVLAEVSLLGLGDAETAQVRRAVAGDFARATGVAELDADVALEAVAASGVGVLPEKPAAND